MLRHLILDIGNVICDWDPDRLVSQTFDTAQDQAEALSVTVNTPDWLMLDRGTLALNDAIHRAQARTQLPGHKIAEVYANMSESLTELTGTTEAMRRAQAANVPIYILSNMQSHAWDYLNKSYSCWSYCDGVVVSCDVGLIKPEPAIYQHLCERFSVTPESCVFVDDMKVNIDAAIAFGMQGVQLTDKHAGGEVIDELVARIVGQR